MNNKGTTLRGSLAIDLGSTTTVVAFQAENENLIKLLDLPPISRTAGEIPSLIWQCQDQVSSYFFGQEIEDLQLVEKKDQNLISDFKRWIGAPKEKRQGNDFLTPEKAGELLIKEIWRRIPKNIEVQRLVLTAPVETYKEYRKWLHSIFVDLDVPEIALVDEPTAAAIGSGQAGGTKILVVDMGGSTIDMSMVLLEGGEGQAEPIAQLIRFNGEDLEGISKQVFRGAKVLGKAGLRLGGQDLDKWILQYLCPKAKQTNTLLKTAEKLKCRLSNNELSETKNLTQQVISNKKEAIDKLNLSRLQFEELLIQKGLFKTLSKLLEQTLAQGRSKGYELDDLTGVVIVGGGSRIPIIRKWLLQKVGHEKLIIPPPIEAVAVGALKLTPGVTIRDVLTQGISLQFWDQKTNQHTWHPLFFPGQPWPTTKPLEIIISPSTTNQLEVELIIADNKINDIQEVIYIDGIPTIKNNDEQSISRIIPWKDSSILIKLDPPGIPGEDCLKLEFTINNFCQLCVKGFDIRNGQEVIQKMIGEIR